MEALFIYAIKSSCLILLFYLAYYFLLRKETFFTGNRWFLLSGLFTSALLPSFYYTKTIWVEPTPINFDWSRIPLAAPLEKETFEIDWFLILAIAYSVGIIVFLLKFAFDFYSLKRVLKENPIQSQADFKFMDVAENVAPFSYFNTIVYNSSLYTPIELENILEHEKVHSEQNHTLDVLITRLFCILFWFNPFIWLYQKAILQNLEFIADSEATKKISDKKAYQFTLLKITTHENCVAITNHFYQSLIKKRIVMLNKNQSKKWNSWKYILILPALVAFVLLFQIEIIAKEKNQITKIETATPPSEEIYKITKNTTEAELEEKAATITKNHGLIVIFSGIERNANKELTALSVELKKGSEITQNRTVKGSKAINPFGIVITKDSKGILVVDFVEEAKVEDTFTARNSTTSLKQPIPADTEIFINGLKSEKSEMDKLNTDDIATVDVIKADNKNEIRIVTKKYSISSPDAKYSIADEKVDENIVLQIKANPVEAINTNTNSKTIRIVSKKGNQISLDKNSPVAPTPPTPPVFNFKTPTAPKFPQAPKAPKGDPTNGDQKEWKAFEKKMNDYEVKMKKLEPQIEAFEKQMEAFEKQMEPFNKEMEIFEKKMKVYEQQMEQYQSKVEK
jgi:hypothetical protein